MQAFLADNSVTSKLAMETATQGKHKTSATRLAKNIF
jgi:hypothetical protein